MRLYVGNLSDHVTDSDLQNLFGAHGTVRLAKVSMDRKMGHSKGFGFVEMDNEEDAHMAIDALNGQEIKGRTLKVNEARPREDRCATRVAEALPVATGAAGDDTRY